MMTIQEEIRAEKVSHLNWNEIREQKAYESMQKKQTQNLKAKIEAEREQAKEYIQVKLQKGDIQITQEDINKYPQITHQIIANMWNKQMMQIINKFLEYRFDKNSKIVVTSEDSSLHYKEEKIYGTDILGNATDVIDIFCEPLSIIHVKCENKDFHLFETDEYDELIVASKLRYRPNIIKSDFWIYKLEEKIL